MSTFFYSVPAPAKSLVKAAARLAQCKEGEHKGRVWVGFAPARAAVVIGVGHEDRATMSAFSLDAADGAKYAGEDVLLVAPLSAGTEIAGFAYAGGDKLSYISKTGSMESLVASVSVRGESFYDDAVCALVDDATAHYRVEVDKGVKARIRAVSKAVSRDETLPILCGMIVSVHADGVRFYGTDRYRAVSFDAVADAVSDASFQFYGGVSPLLHRAATAAHVQALEFSQYGVRVVFGGAQPYTVSTAYSVQDAPKLEALFDADLSKAEVDIEFAQAKEVAAFIKTLDCDRNTPVVVDAVASRVSAQCAGEEYYCDTPDVTSPLDGCPKVAYNPKYLVDFLALAGAGDSVRARAVKPYRPAFFEVGCLPDVRLLLMPVRLPNY